MANLGTNYRDAGRLSEGLVLLEEVYRVPKRPASLRWVGNELLECFVKADKKQEAMTFAKEFLVEVRSQQPKGSLELAGSLAPIGLSLLQLKAYAEAEPLLRECLAIREAKEPDDWRTFNARSMLGGTLLGLKNYTEAEPLLLSGYEGMKQREKTIVQAGKTRIPEAIERLVQFYEVMGKEDDAARWRKELELTKAAQKKTEKHP
jgi:tetratricopeptide (TPR) repeat protein